MEEKISKAALAYENYIHKLGVKLIPGQRQAFFLSNIIRAHNKLTPYTFLRFFLWDWRTYTGFVEAPWQISSENGRSVYLKQLRALQYNGFDIPTGQEEMFGLCVFINMNHLSLNSNLAIKTHKAVYVDIDNLYSYFKPDELPPQIYSCSRQFFTKQFLDTYGGHDEKSVVTGNERREAFIQELNLQYLIQSQWDKMKAYDPNDSIINIDITNQPPLIPRTDDVAEFKADRVDKGGVTGIITEDSLVDELMTYIQDNLGKNIATREDNVGRKLNINNFKDFEKQLQADMNKKKGGT